MKIIFNWFTIISAIMLILTVLLQSQGQSLGVSFGGDSNFYRSKRGVEKVIFNSTIIFAVVFVLSVILGILSKR